MESRNIKDFIENMNRMSVNGESFLFIVDFNLTSASLILIEECALNDIYFDIEGKTNSYISDKTGIIELKKQALPYSDYLDSFNYVQNEISKGNSYLVNLTCSTPVESNLSLTEIFHKSVARYKLLYKDQFLVFSPESFVKISEGKIRTFPMKGTIDASIENAREILLNNKKEAAEHATTVDLLRNDLSRVASNVTVEKYRYIEKINTSGKNLFQMSSVISGDLPKGYHRSIGDIVTKLLPAGSISGAPKKKTLEIISAAEKHERGFYTGIFGIFDGINLNSGVMIRFIENQNGRLVYKSGGGITAMSDPKEEYQELIDKIYVPVN
jgi:para-aminobenzoate synthetase component 1